MWLPIATAPQNRTWILVCHPKWAMPEIAWWDEKQYWRGYLQTKPYTFPPIYWQPLEPKPTV